MIRLVFTMNKEVVSFTIKERIVRYYDRVWKSSVQFLPKDHDFLRKIRNSRNALPMKICGWIQDANSGKNLEEYQNCKDDEAIADIIVRECRLKGLKLQKRFEV